MAKALYGHLAAEDPRLASENDRLRARVAELSALVDRLQRELNDAESAPTVVGVSLAQEIDGMLAEPLPALV